MDASQTLQPSSFNTHVEIISLQVIDTNENQIQETDVNEFDYSQRGQWLRAAVLGANDGLVSVASLMMGVSSVKEDTRAVIVAGFAGLVAGACSMAIGEYVSVCTQRDVEVAQMRREKRKGTSEGGNDHEKLPNPAQAAVAPARDVEVAQMRREKRKGTSEGGDDHEKLPNPAQAAVASALAFAVGAVLPLLAAAFIKQHKLRTAVVVLVASVALLVFGVMGALLGGTPVAKPTARVLVGGWMAMGTTFGLTKLV